MNVKQQLLAKFTDGSFALCTAPQVAGYLKLRGKEALYLKNTLLALVREGELLCDLRGRFGTAEQFGAKRGKIAGNERGFGFFVPFDGSGDLFLSRRSIKNALHGDDVLCFPTGDGDEGEVLAVLARGYSEIAGTFRSERACGFVRADERKFSEEVYIQNGKTGGAWNGAKVIAKITSYDGRTPIGEITEILGNGGDLFAEERSVIRAHSLKETFPPEVLEEAEKQAGRDPLAHLQGRLDLRDKLVVTVDGEDTRDIDDAISVEKRDGIFLLGVHIADVSHYVKKDSALDMEAFSRGTSVYFPDRVLPMLPPALSNGICSLDEGAPRLTLSCLMKVGKDGTVLEKEIRPSVICSRHRLTYTEVTAIANGETRALERYPDLIGFVSDAVELTETLKAARRRRGGVDMEVGETKIFYRDGTIELPPRGRTISHEMIEQFMILANESVAEIMTKMETPFVYRVHERPAEEKATLFAEFLKAAGLQAGFDPKNVAPGDYAAVLDGIADPRLSAVVSRVMLRSMMKAAYSPVNIGHFGLASECYCHFTSPIRRYPDLCIHRIIKAALAERSGAEKYRGDVARVSVRSSACEKNAEEAERDVDALYLAAYMKDKIGETYEAVISGVTAFGLFAELENGVEGFIPIETLPDDEYTVLAEQFVLKGTKRAFRLGQEVVVQAVGADLGARRVQFSLTL